jgi:hypothetical protein
MKTLDLRSYADGHTKEAGGYVENWMERENRIQAMIDKYRGMTSRGKRTEKVRNTRKGRVPKRVIVSDGTTYDSVAIAAGILKCSESLVRQAIQSGNSIRGVFLDYEADGGAR